MCTRPPLGGKAISLRRISELIIAPQLYFLGVLLWEWGVGVLIWLIFPSGRKFPALLRDFSRSNISRALMLPSFQVMFASWNREESGLEYWGQVYSEALKWESGRYIIVPFLTFFGDFSVRLNRLTTQRGKYMLTVFYWMNFFGLLARLCCVGKVHCACCR